MYYIKFYVRIIKIYLKFNNISKNNSNKYFNIIEPLSKHSNVPETKYNLVKCYRCERVFPADKMYSCRGPKVPDNTFECIDSTSCNILFSSIQKQNNIMRQLERVEKEKKQNDIYAKQLFEKYGIDFKELKKGGIPCRCIGPKWHRSENYKKEFNGFYNTHGENGSIRFIKFSQVMPQYYFLYNDYNINVTEDIKKVLSGNIDLTIKKIMDKEACF